MLVIAKSLSELSFPQLMEVYAESNLENGQDFWPEEPEGQQILQAEQGFRAYLQEDFFRQPGAVYYVWQERGRYVSALRMEPYQDGLLLEALETAPNKRRQGFGTKLMGHALEHCGGQRVYAHVSKRNAASLAVHEKCGFAPVLDYAVYVDGSVNQNCFTLLHQG